MSSQNNQCHSCSPFTLTAAVAMIPWLHGVMQDLRESVKAIAIAKAELARAEKKFRREKMRADYPCRREFYKVQEQTQSTINESRTSIQQLQQLLHTAGIWWHQQYDRLLIPTVDVLRYDAFFIFDGLDISGFQYDSDPDDCVRPMQKWQGSNDPALFNNGSAGILATMRPEIGQRVWLPEQAATCDSDPSICGGWATICEVCENFAYGCGGRPSIMIVVEEFPDTQLNWNILYPQQRELKEKYGAQKARYVF